MNLIKLRLQLGEPAQLRVELFAEFVKLIFHERQYFGGLHPGTGGACRPLFPAHAVRARCSADTTLPGQPTFSRFALRPAICASSAHQDSDYHTRRRIA